MRRTPGPRVTSPQTLSTASSPAISRSLVVDTLVSRVRPSTWTDGPKPQGTTTEPFGSTAGHGSPSSATSPTTTGIAVRPVAVAVRCSVVAVTVIVTRRAAVGGSSTSPSGSSTRRTVREPSVTSTSVGRRPAMSGSWVKRNPVTWRASGQDRRSVGRVSPASAAQYVRGSPSTTSCGERPASGSHRLDAAARTPSSRSSNESAPSPRGTAAPAAL